MVLNFLTAFSRMVFIIVWGLGWLGLAGRGHIFFCWWEIILLRFTIKILVPHRNIKILGMGELFRLVKVTVVMHDAALFKQVSMRQEV